MSMPSVGVIFGLPAGQPCEAMSRIKAEICVFAGIVLQVIDPAFQGFQQRGGVEFQIGDQDNAAREAYGHVASLPPILHHPRTPVSPGWLPSAAKRICRAIRWLRISATSSSTMMRSCCSSNKSNKPMGSGGRSGSNTSRRPAPKSCGWCRSCRCRACRKGKSPCDAPGQLHARGPVRGRGGFAGRPGHGDHFRSAWGCQRHRSC